MSFLGDTFSPCKPSNNKKVALSVWFSRQFRYRVMIVLNKSGFKSFEMVYILLTFSVMVIGYYLWIFFYYTAASVSVITLQKYVIKILLLWIIDVIFSLGIAVLAGRSPLPCRTTPRSPAGGVAPPPRDRPSPPRPAFYHAHYSLRC